MSRTKSILLPVLLALPVLLFLWHHYFRHSPNLHPTGFTVDENVLYMSYAHQYLDEPGSLFYSNPFDGEPNSPKIYFQPVNFLFAGAMKMGMDPGLCFSLFGLIAAIACIYIGIRIIQHLLDKQKDPSLVAVLFTWGGGLTAIVGLLASTFLGEHQQYPGLDGIFAADPANGWWGLNWGRNLFIPLEAYYHFLFLLNIYLLLKKKWGLALFFSLFLSISHPFTGIEYLSIILGWLFIEKMLKNKNIPYWLVAGILLVTVFHVWYYLIYLNQFPEHKQLFSQYSAGWTYSLLVAIPAYCLVGSLTLFAAWKYRPVKNFLSVPHQRLFLCWAIISFLLSKHEWFIKPMQPIHFTRGYSWAGLFLLSLPGLVWLIQYLRSGKKWILAVFVIILLSDNVLWVTNLLRKKDTVEWEGHISTETKEVLDFLKLNGKPNDLLIGNATLVNYLANAYSPVNARVSHPFNTPMRDQRLLQMNQFFETGEKPHDWNGRRLIIVIDTQKNDSLSKKTPWKGAFAFNNRQYAIFFIP